MRGNSCQLFSPHITVGGLQSGHGQGCSARRRRRFFLRGFVVFIFASSLVPPHDLQFGPIGKFCNMVVIIRFIGLQKPGSEN
jgi:hypothetical protein